ncbi:MAG: hypothetical protein EXS03_05815 [Phycisphaerales bacterium]|nr:hypothetical protein [Phycisphaerales bacterium]
MSDPLPTIAFDLFAKIDFRVATIVGAEIHPNADKLLKIRLDDGTPEGRQVCAGIRSWYDPATLIGRQVIIVANLEPRTLRGEVSAGMILVASDLKVAPAAGGTPTALEGAPAVAPAIAKPGPDERDVILLTLDRPAAPGSKVS